MRSMVPRATLAAATAAVGLVLVAAVAAPGAGVSPLVVRIAEFLLAGGAAYLLDDAALVLTTVMPLGLWRRRLPRLLRGAAVLAGAWVLILAVVRWQESLPPLWLVTGELLVVCLVAMATSAALAGRGEAEPGGLVAPAVGLLGITAVLAEPVLRLSIFVPWDGSGGAAVRLAWLAAGVVAAGVVVVASRDPAGHPPRLWVTSPRRRSNDSGSA